MKVVKFFDEFSSQTQEYDTFLESNSCQNKHKLLFNQMPKQDISIQFCHHVLGNKAFKNYKKFIEKRNTKSMDVGLCLKNYSNINLVIFVLFQNKNLVFWNTFLFFLQDMLELWQGNYIKIVLYSHKKHRLAKRRGKNLLAFRLFPVFYVPTIVSWYSLLYR